MDPMELARKAVARQLYRERTVASLGYDWRDYGQVGRENGMFGSRTGEWVPREGTLGFMGQVRAVNQYDLVNRAFADIVRKQRSATAARGHGPRSLKNPWDQTDVLLKAAARASIAAAPVGVTQASLFGIPTLGDVYR